MAKSGSWVIAKVQKLSDEMGGRFRFSLAGVPHFLVDVEERRYSICYFAKRRRWVVFYPYRQDPQTKVALRDEAAVKDFIYGMGDVSTPADEGPSKR